jgi:type IX secretion system substrate protein
MKRLTKIIGSLIFILLFLPIISYSQWEKSTGLDGGELTEMVSLDSVLFAISPKLGIFSKSNNGDWQHSYNEQAGNLISSGNCIIARQNYMSAPVRSFDYGNTWETLNHLDGVYKILSIDTVLFFGPYYTLRSFDYGDTYDTIQLPESVQNYEAYSLCDDSLYYAYFCNDDGLNKLYYSANYGETWDTICKSGLLSDNFGIIQHISYMNGTFWARVRYFSASSTEIHVFDWNQNQWNDITNNLPGAVHNHLYEYDGTIYCCVDNHPVYQFNDGDSTWIKFTNISKNVNKLLACNDQLFCVTDQGAYSIDTNGIFTELNSGLSHRNITSIDELNDDIFVAANSEIFKSTDGGTSFVKMENAYGFQIIATDSVIYTLSPHDLRRSWDGGETWYTSSNWLRCPNGSLLKNMSITNTYCFVGTDQGLYRSLQGTFNWNRLENGPFYPNFIVENVEAIGRTVIAGEQWYTQNLYQSRTHGATFSFLDDYYNISKVDQTFYILKDTITYSDDMGASWKKIQYSPQNNVGHCIDIKGDTIIIGGRDVYGNPSLQMTYSPLIHWIDIIDDLPNSSTFSGEYIADLKIVDGKIFVANPVNGLWYRDDILTGTSTENERPKKSEVSVFPNPVSNEAYFKFAFPSSNKVQISIYNHCGEIVDVIRLMNTGGQQQYVWNVKDKPAGIYYYRISGGGNSVTGKIVVVN